MEESKIRGAEGIVVHQGQIVLGMQRPNRWYNLENGEQAGIIKTLGGQIEFEDQNSSKKALIREILEEVSGIDESDIRISKSPVFSKTIGIRDLNPYEKQSNLIMNADFYIVQLVSRETLQPNDLPALVKLPLDKFLELEFCKSQSTRNIANYIIKNEEFEGDLPENHALMVPKDVKLFFERIMDDLER